VVLEAGRNDVAASWQPVMALLAPHVHVVAYDRAGLGGSAPSADPVVLARQVRDLESVITSAAAGPCVLVGHSWGGILVQVLAWRRPELVAGLVLVDPAHEQMTGGLPRLARRAVRLARAGRRDELRGGDTTASAAVLQDLRAAPRPFPDVPVVVLSAARGFPRRFRAHWTGLQKDLAASAPRGRHLVIDGSGHGIHQDRPDAVADAILQVIAEVRASQARTGDIPAWTSRPLPHAFPAVGRPSDHRSLPGLRCNTPQSRLTARWAAWSPCSSALSRLLCASRYARAGIARELGATPQPGPAMPWSLRGRCGGEVEGGADAVLDECAGQVAGVPGRCGTPDHVSRSSSPSLRWPG